METNIRTEEELVDFLINKYQPLAILLHGSRATGRARQHSDWDIAIVKGPDTPLVEHDIINGNALDIEIIDQNISDEELVKESGPFARAKVLYERDLVGTKILERVRAYLERGRQQLSQSEYESRKHFLYRLKNRLKNYSGSPEEYFYFIGDYYRRAIRYWFDVRCEWSLPVYDALPFINDNDPAFFKELAVISSDASVDVKQHSIENVYKLLFEGNKSNDY